MKQMQVRYIEGGFKLICNQKSLEHILAIADFLETSTQNEFNLSRSSLLNRLPYEMKGFFDYYLDTEVRQNPICITYKDFEYYSVVENKSISFKLL